MEELKLVLSPTAPPQPDRPAVSTAPTQVPTVTLHAPQALPIRTTPPSIKVTPPYVKVTPPPYRPMPLQRIPGDPAAPRPPSLHQLPIAPAPTLYSSVQSRPLIKHMLQYRPLPKGAPNPLIIPKPTSIQRRVSAKTILQSAGQKANQQCLLIGGPATLAAPIMTTPAPVQSQQSTTPVPSIALPLVLTSTPLQTQYNPRSPVHAPPSMSQTPVTDPSLGPVQLQLTTTAEAPPTPLQGSAHLLLCNPAQKPTSPSPPAPSPVRVTHSPSPPPVSEVMGTPSPPHPPPQSSPSPSTTLKALQLLKALVQESELIPKRRAPDPEDEPEPPEKIQSPPLSLPLSPCHIRGPQIPAAELEQTPRDSQAGHKDLCAEESVEGSDAPPLASAGSDGPREDLPNPSAAPCIPSMNSDAGSPPLEQPASLLYPDSTPYPLRQTPVRCASQSPTASLPTESPQAIVRPQILTHLVEGFVIQEGLEPFPVSRSSLMVDQLAHEAADIYPGDPPMDVDEVENSDVDSATTDDLDKLLCEFCGKRGPSHSFLRSQRFCSLQCVRGFNMAYSKRMNALKAKKMGRWTSRTEGRRSRQTNPLEGGHGERHHQAPKQYGATSPFPKEATAEKVEKPSIPMTTRLRRQVEHRPARARAKSAPDWVDRSALAAPTSSPGLWTVDQVWAFIHSMPGCQDIAEEFRSQEIDGQALLLLTEDHLMGAMKLKLGPALKIHARISDLKGS
ncbi:polyhomeotic-like protein 3 isoform X2 [Brienomyrus brachyistius]|uniref:polyhomeotic-like protein 3 isoform X2 n=1 Tax=Brienomyrus brachyistius TaxID=42636 RepID=UPI0020B1BDE2|nr:polyhomeotic-like protein 3 isoform X2 [Brienomyrus brachyistius]